MHKKEKKKKESNALLRQGNYEILKRLLLKNV
jgi:hypothetical protein